MKRTHVTTRGCIVVIDGGAAASQALTAEERHAKRERLRVVLGGPAITAREQRLEEINRQRKGVIALLVAWGQEYARIKAELRGKIFAKE
jgi:hypothetical protein